MASGALPSKVRAEGQRGQGTLSQAGSPPSVTAAAVVSPTPQKLAVDLSAVQGLLQSRQQRLQPGERAAGSSRLCDLYWQAMKALGVQ